MNYGGNKYIFKFTEKLFDRNEIWNTKIDLNLKNTEFKIIEHQNNEYISIPKY